MPAKKGPPGSTPRERLAASSEGKQAAPADTTRSGPDPIPISPAIGPLPPVYLPPQGQPGPAGLLWQATVQAVRRAAVTAVRRRAGTLAWRLPLTRHGASRAGRRP
jgi:hypothetical protein